MQMKKRMLLLGSLLLLALAVSALASAPQIATRRCTQCGASGEAYLYSAAYPTIPQRTVCDVWRCENGHAFKIRSQETQAAAENGPKAVYPEENQSWGFFPMGEL